jgi:hypothetical protein
MARAVAACRQLTLLSAHKDFLVWGAQRNTKSADRQREKNDQCCPHQTHYRRDGHSRPTHDNGSAVHRARSLFGSPLLTLR